MSYQFRILGKALLWKGLRNARLRHTFAAQEIIAVDRLQRNWNYQPSNPDFVDRVRRFMARNRLHAPPKHKVIVPITRERPRWLIYFIYLPSGGRLDAAHRYSLERLHESEAGLVVVCAAPTPDKVPVELRDFAGSLIWKALPGYDFSAYALALHEVARASPGADVLVLNDSVFGPFGPIDGLWSSMKWDLTGFTASGQVQNHIQSYAFHLRDVTPDRMASLSDIFPTEIAYNDYQAVILRQETRLALVASRSMTVGAQWYGAATVTDDPSLFAAIPLIEAGFPFLKRGLLSKHAGIFPTHAILDLLKQNDHPIPSTKPSG